MRSLTCSCRIFSYRPRLFYISTAFLHSIYRFTDLPMSIPCVQLDSTALIILTTFASICTVLLFCILTVLLLILSRFPKQSGKAIPPLVSSDRSAIIVRDRRHRRIRNIQSRNKPPVMCSTSQPDDQSLPSSLSGSPPLLPKTRDALVQCDDLSCPSMPKRSGPISISVTKDTHLNISDPSTSAKPSHNHSNLPWSSSCKVPVDLTSTARPL